MAKDVIMPQMGESIAEGTITKWLKKVGDSVERDEPLFEISTDKVDAEIPSPSAGVLTEIKVPEGETVEVNSVVATIDSAGGGATEASAEKPEPSAKPGEEQASTKQEPAGPEKPDAPEKAPAEAAGTGSAGASGANATGAAPGSPAPKVEKPYDRYSPEELRKVRSSPVVRRIAEEHGVDLSTIEGTGISGRVTKKDILDHIESGAHESPASKTETAAAPSHAPAPAPKAPAAPASRSGAEGSLFIPDLRIPPYAEGDAVAIEPMSVMRRKIAEHMIYSQSVSAHVTSFFEIDFEAVVRQRAAQKAEFAQRDVKLTFMPFIIRAVVEGLKRFPYVNASVMGDQVVFKKDINIGIAVALEEGKGLIVPVIRQADEKNLMGLARAVNDLGDRARNKQLTPDDVQKGTFSITNPGVFGGLMGTPIINQPQVAILGVGAIEKRPVVIDDAIAIRHRAYFTLSYDHRLVDGAMAEMFMAHVKAFLEAGNIQ